MKPNAVAAGLGLRAFKMPLLPDQIERYSRHILLKEVGGQGQQKLLGAKVLVIGAGGLGSPILLYLAAAGIGTIGIVDDDKITLSNLQRQIIHDTDHVGQSKLDSAKMRINALNPDVTVILYHDKIDQDNAARLIEPYDLVIEGVDNFATRFILNQATIAARKTLISAAVGRFEGQVATFKPWQDPGILPCYRCLVADEPPRDSQINCDEEGILGAVTGVVGALAAMEALKEIAGIGTSLAGRLLIYDGLSAHTRTVNLPADPACADCGIIQ